MSADNEADLHELRRQADVAFAAGFDSLCLTHRVGFHGDTCPQCWPPNEQRAFTNASLFGSLRSPDIYGWLCTKIGGLPANTGDVRRWVAVREALNVAVMEHGEP